jgi:putative SOS response-associated peptidase YedK
VCGRYVQVSSPTLLAERFDIDEIAIEEAPGANYNVAPRTEVLAIRQRKAAEPDDEPPRRVLEQMRWGLVPSWAEDPKIGDRLINARAESVAEKPAFKTAFRKRRCILPADGFYEWQAVPGGPRKQPMFVHRVDGEPLAFAGLWEVWRDHEQPETPWLVSCTIVTTRANATMAPVHDRMPVILPEGTWDAWLDPRVDDRTRLEDLLVPAADDLLELWPVSTQVNSANNRGPELAERVEPEEPQTLFS